MHKTGSEHVPVASSSEPGLETSDFIYQGISYIFERLKAPRESALRNQLIKQSHFTLLSTARLTVPHVSTPQHSSGTIVRFFFFTMLVIDKKRSAENCVVNQRLCRRVISCLGTNISEKKLPVFSGFNFEVI